MRVHAEHGAALAFGDGWKVWCWHGVNVPGHWIEDRENLDPSEVLKTRNMEQRAAGMQIIGWAKAEAVLGSSVIHDSKDASIGQLVEMSLPGLTRPGRWLKAQCPRNGQIFAGVPHESPFDNLPIDTALAAQAYLAKRKQADYQHPPRRT